MGDSEQLIELSVGSRDSLPLAWLPSRDLALPGPADSGQHRGPCCSVGGVPVFPESLRAGARRKDRCGQIVPEVWPIIDAP